MKKFEFKSAICTSVEESKRLLELGLKKETADMYYTNAGLPFIKDEFHLECKSFKELSNNLSAISPFTFIPAWSLHRLMEIAYKGDILGCVALNYHEKNIATYYEQVIKVIEYLVNIKEFNPEYLEETICQQD